MILLKIPTEQLAIILFAIGIPLIAVGIKAVMQKVSTELNVSFGSGKLEMRSLGMAMLVIGLLLEAIAVFQWFFLNS